MKQLTKYLPKSIKMRYPVVRLMTLIVVLGVMTVAVPAFAADGTGFDEIITSITSLIQDIALVLAVLGLVIWGLGKVARPVFPEISSMTQQYIPNMIIGLVVIFGAAKIVEKVGGAIGAS